MAKGTAVTTAKVNLPADWEKRMRADAEKYKAQEANVGVGQFLSTRGGVLQFQGTPVPGNKLRCVVLHSIHVNAFYPGKFDADSPTSPVCYAFGTDEKELAPHEEAADKQAERCADCPQNKFGSAETGRGKACKNGRRLSLIHVDSLRSATTVGDDTPSILGLPPTSLPSWATYVKTLESSLGLPPYAVITEIGIVPDPKSQFKVTFTLVEKIRDRKVMAAVFMKHAEAEAAIAFPFPAAEVAPTRKKPKAKAKAAKQPPPQARRAAPATPGRSKF